MKNYVVNVTMKNYGVFDLAAMYINAETNKKVVRFVRVGSKNGRSVYAAEFNDGTESDYYINFDGTVEKE